jgi:hypothetical protein
MTEQDTIDLVYLCSNCFFQTRDATEYIAHQKKHQEKKKIHYEGSVGVEQ